MASRESRRLDSGRGSLRALVGVDILCMGWLPVVVIGVLHYTTPPHYHWAHDVLRRLYYVPILFAAFSQGIRGGLGVAVIVSLSYWPHAFFLSHGLHDPASTSNKVLEVVLYNTIGLLAGLLADREAARRREAERAVAEQKRMAEQLIRAGRLAALGELVAGVAHEIKNPLHTLKGTAEIVDEIIPKDASQAAMWTVLRQEIDRLGRVAERFLSFARPQKPILATPAFEQLYERLKQLLHAQMRSHQTMLFTIDPLPSDAKGICVQADVDQIAQVALNIGSNAIEATKGQGSVRLSGQVLDDNGERRISIQLANNGPAIPDADLERVFDPFFTNTANGTGLGLAIAARIIEEHGGFIEVRNAANGAGVVFTVLLPFTNSHQDKPRALEH